MLVKTLKKFQGTHILGASRSHLSDSMIFLFSLLLLSLISMSTILFLLSSLLVLLFSLLILIYISASMYHTKLSKLPSQVFVCLTSNWFSL